MFWPLINNMFGFLFTEPLVNRFATRRKSVFAETYDPENDADEDEGAAAIFPKSDEQRARLIESVKNILLFRSLDKEQVSVRVFLLSFFESMIFHPRSLGEAFASNVIKPLN